MRRQWNHDEDTTDMLLTGLWHKANWMTLMKILNRHGVARRPGKHQRKDTGAASGDRHDVQILKQPFVR
jgi:hypothetical protein